MAKETFCIDLDNIAELRDARRMLDEHIAALDTASIEDGMRKIRDSIGFEAANRLFDAIEDCDMVDCTMDEFTRGYDGDVKEALKDSFPEVFDAIPKGAKIYDSVAKLVGVMDTEWKHNPAQDVEFDKDDNLVKTLYEPYWKVKPVHNQNPEVPGWAEAQNKFNQCQDDCIVGITFNWRGRGQRVRVGYAKINGIVYWFQEKPGGIRGDVLFERQRNGELAYPKMIDETMLNMYQDAEVFFEQRIPADIWGALLEAQEFAEKDIDFPEAQRVEMTDAEPTKEEIEAVMKRPDFEREKRAGKFWHPKGAIKYFKLVDLIKSSDTNGKVFKLTRGGKWVDEGHTAGNFYYKTADGRIYRIEFTNLANPTERNMQAKPVDDILGRTGWGDPDYTEDDQFNFAVENLDPKLSELVLKACDDLNKYNHGGHANTSENGTYPKGVDVFNKEHTQDAKVEDIDWNHNDDDDDDPTPNMTRWANQQPRSQYEFNQWYNKNNTSAARQQQEEYLRKRAKHFNAYGDPITDDSVEDAKHESVSEYYERIKADTVAALNGAADVIVASIGAGSNAYEDQVIEGYGKFKNQLYYLPANLSTGFTTPEPLGGLPEKLFELSDKKSPEGYIIKAIERTPETEEYFKTMEQLIK